MRESVEFLFPSSQLPGNSQIVALYDSTRSFRDVSAPAATLFAPGSTRGRLRKGRIEGWIKPTGQAVTLSFYLKTGDAGTSADWELDTTVTGTSSTGYVSVASGATQLISWAPRTNEATITITAGGTAPSAIAAGGSIVWDRVG